LERKVKTLSDRTDKDKLSDSDGIYLHNWKEGNMGEGEIWSMLSPEFKASMTGYYKPGDEKGKTDEELYEELVGPVQSTLIELKEGKNTYLCYNTHMPQDAICSMTELIYNGNNREHPGSPGSSFILEAEREFATQKVRHSNGKGCLEVFAWGP
jgi:hypothetical protein